ncbi:MAG: hypothetical protein GY822_25345 [Deltaproteobacteria bacterium]|nr:hypothetical protein [Deltaproteobacteria bacterium]
MLVFHSLAGGTLDVTVPLSEEYTNLEFSGTDQNGALIIQKRAANFHTVDGLPEPGRHRYHFEIPSSFSGSPRFVFTHNESIDGGGAPETIKVFYLQNLWASGNSAKIKR